MKKILLIILLTFTSLTFAAEGRYVIVAAQDTYGGVYILDTKDGSVRFCSHRGQPLDEILNCSKPNEDKN